MDDKEYPLGKMIFMIEFEDLASLAFSDDPNERRRSRIYRKGNFKIWFSMKVLLPHRIMNVHTAIKPLTWQSPTMIVYDWKGTVINRNGSNPNLEFGERIHLSELKNFIWNFGIHHPDVMNEQNGYVKNDKCLVKFEIGIRRVEGYYSPRVFNFYSKPIGEYYQFHFPKIATMYCSKAVFSHHSSFFEDSNSDEVVLDESLFDAMDQFLEALHGFPIEFQTFTSSSKLLELSAKFQTFSIIRKYEIHVLSNNPTIDHILFLSSRVLKYKMRQILNRGYSWKTTSISSEDLPIFDDCPVEMLKLLVKKYVQQKSKKELKRFGGLYSLA